MNVPVPQRAGVGVKRIPVPTMVGEPRDPVVTELIARSAFTWSVSVSLERTSTVTAALRFVVSESLTAIGASLTQVITNEPVAMLLVAPEASRSW